MEKTNPAPERMREIQIFGVPALFTTKRISYATVPTTMFRYELVAVADFPEQPHHLVEDAEEHFFGTVLTPVAIAMDLNSERGIEPGDLFLHIDAGNYTPEEFEEKYLSPNYGPRNERYGKPD